MVPKLNYALMLILSAGLLAGLTLLAVSASGRPDHRPVTEAELKALINMLCSEREESVREAEKRLTEIGAPARPRLEELAGSENRDYAARARKVLALIDRTPPAKP